MPFDESDSETEDEQLVCDELLVALEPQESFSSSSDESDLEWAEGDLDLENNFVIPKVSELEDHIMRSAN